MNNTFVLREAHATARRLLASAEKEEDRIDNAFRTIFARSATEAERQRIGAFLQHQLETLPADKTADGIPRAEAAWALVVQALLASAEFRYLQ